MFEQNKKIASYKESPDYEDLFLSVRADDKTHRIFLKDIVYIVAEQNFVFYHLIDKTKVIEFIDLSLLEQLLPPNKFTRIQNLLLVAIDCIQNQVGNNLELINGVVLPIGSAYRKKVKGMIKQFR